jgi:hypothetical protein
MINFLAEKASNTIELEAMGLFRFFKYKYLINNRRKRYASLAVSIALAHASFGQATYKSIGNGLADITLSLEKDQRFHLDLTDLSQHKKYALAGKWSVENDQYVLTFKKAKKDLSELFTGTSGFQSYAQIADNRTVKFPQTRAGLMINGIYCTRLS